MASNLLESDSEEMRPVALHAEQITFEASLRHIYRKRLDVVDVELTYPMVKFIIKELEQWSTLPGQGSIRVRVKGRMVLE